MSLVLEVAHLVGEAAGRVALRVEVEVAQHEAHEALAVGGVVDREGRLHPDLGGLAAQDPHAGRVEGHDPHGARAGPDERLDTLAHLGRGLVGEGDGEDLARLGPPLAEQPRDAVRQHTGLAGAGTRDDEQRRALVDDGLALLRVEPLEQDRRVEVGASLRCRLDAAAGRGLGPRGDALVGDVRATPGAPGPAGGRALTVLETGDGEVVEERAHDRPSLRRTTHSTGPRRTATRDGRGWRRERLPDP